MNTTELKAALIARGFTDAAPMSLCDDGWAVGMWSLIVEYWTSEDEGVTSEGIYTLHHRDVGPEVERAEGETEEAMVARFLALEWIGHATVAHVLGLGVEHVYKRLRR